jgi:hypothetical protein
LFLQRPDVIMSLNESDTTIPAAGMQEAYDDFDDFRVRLAATSTRGLPYQYGRSGHTGGARSTRPKGSISSSGQDRGHVGRYAPSRDQVEAMERLEQKPRAQSRGNWFWTQHTADRTAGQIVDRRRPERPAEDWPHMAGARGSAAGRCQLGHACRGVRVCRPSALDQTKKQHTGFTPEQLREHIRNDEAFWFYRFLDRVFDDYLARQKGQ